MKTTIVYETESGNIRQFGRDLVNRHPDRSVIEIDTDIDLLTQVDYYRVDSGQLVLKTDHEQLRSQRRLAEIRARRNQLIAVTDWTQLPDVDLTEQQQQQWRHYRQLLREIPDALPPDLPELYQVDWPEKPE